MTSSVGVSLIGDIAGRWRALTGFENNWKGLLDPLDIDLRRSLLNYGDRSNAIGNATNDKTKNQCRGFSRHPPEDFFIKLGLQCRNPYKYTLTKFCYANEQLALLPNWNKGSAWFAYVAVATDDGKALLGRREIVVAWRGTSSDKEGILDFEAFQVSASDIFGKVNGADPKVHGGFYSLYTSKDPDSIYSKASARDQVLSEVRRLVEQYKDEEVSITVVGYSAGSALATLNAMDIALSGANGSFPVTAFVFASPRVGNSVFKEVFDGLSSTLKLLRVENDGDPVPSLPLDLPPFFEYVHVGESLAINYHNSPYLRRKADGKINVELVNPHHLDVYLHTISLEKKSDGSYDLAVDYDFALVNKDLDALKDNYGIPAKWWVQKNKGLVLGDDGTYKMDTGFYVPDPPTA